MFYIIYDKRENYNLRILFLKVIFYNCIKEGHNLKIMNTKNLNKKRVFFHNFKTKANLKFYNCHIDKLSKFTVTK